MSVYQHFRPDEKEFIDLVLNWTNYVEERYAPKLTDFLDPREQYIVRTLVAYQGNCQVEFFGGSEKVERKRALLYPEYFDVEKNDFEITLFQIRYPDQFVTLTHPQVLGSLMGLGLKRSKFGDILIKDGMIQFLCAKEIAEFVRLNFTQVGKTNIFLEEVSWDEILTPEEEWIETQITVSSLRLDAVLAQASKLSRQRSLELIKRGLVKVNWKVVEEPSYSLETGDVISARRIGRIRLFEVLNQTKKEKWRISIGKQKN